MECEVERTEEEQSVACGSVLRVKMFLQVGNEYLMFLFIKQIILSEVVHVKV
jgi:hypothetical protein